MAMVGDASSPYRHWTSPRHIVEHLSWSFPPYFNLLFEFCSSSSWRCCRVVFFKSSCSLLFCLLRCLLFLRELRCAPAFVLYPCSQSFGVQGSSLPGFLSTGECFLFFWFLKTV